MSSLDALIEVLESLMPEEVKRQIKQSAESEPGYGEVGSQKFSAFTEMDECFKECRDQPRENRLDLLIDALKQQMPPTVKMLIQQEQDRLDEELMECHEELPESSASSSLSSIDDEEVDSELGWSPHDDEDPMLDNSSDVQEALNEERSIEEIDRETPELNNDLEEEAAYSSRGDIPYVPRLGIAGLNLGQKYILDSVFRLFALEWQFSLSSSVDLQFFFFFSKVFTTRSKISLFIKSSLF